MRILIVGPTGRLGSELLLTLSQDHIVSCINRIDCDLNDLGKLERLIELRKPEVLINATAFNGMEQCANDITSAYKINTLAPSIMAMAAKKIGALFIHFSTDYVFSGLTKEQEDEQEGLHETTPVYPCGIYGVSKLEGERLVKLVDGNSVIFRLSSIYGRQWAGAVDPINQVMQGKGTKGNPIKVLHQWCAPTSTRLISFAVKHVIETTVHTDITGLYHLASSSGTWKADFAEFITKKVFGENFEVEEGTLAVPRPVYTRLVPKAFIDRFDYKLPDCQSDFLVMLKYMPKLSAWKGAAN